MMAYTKINYKFRADTTNKNDNANFQSSENVVAFVGNPMNNGSR